MLSNLQLKSIELLTQFLKETPKQEVEDMISKYANMGIEGPTYQQYLSGLSSNDFIFYNEKSFPPFAFAKAKMALPDKIQVTSKIPDPTFCGVSFLYTFAK